MRAALRSAGKWVITGTSMLPMLAQAIRRGAAKAPSPDLAEAGADSVARKEDGSW